MDLIYGTTNQAKIDFIRTCIPSSLAIKILTLQEINTPQLKIDESGNNPLENARIKAHAYFEALQRPVFSCDSGLYFESVDKQRQPGVHVRNINGRRLNDEEMIQYYASLAMEFGGTLTARYRNAICLIINENMIFESMSMAIAGEPFLLVSKPHTLRRNGFPLDSLAVNRDSGEYYFDTAQHEENLSTIHNGFASFFKKVLQETTSSLRVKR